MLKIDNLTVSFLGTKAINQLSTVFSSPICGLIGPNGAGKTTLANVITGLIKPASGNISWNDKQILGLTARQRVGIGMRRIFQSEYVVENLSVWNNVQAGLDHLRHNNAKFQYTVSQALAYVGLISSATTLAMHLNLYQRRMLEVARSLVGTPKMLLLDEPGAGLSEKELVKLSNVICRIPDEFGAQVILIDHDIEFVAQTCKETVVLNFGMHIAQGITRDVLNDWAVKKIYLGEK